MDIKEIIGKTMVRVEDQDGERIEFETTTGEVYALYHSQHCCESVTIEDINGDLSDLVGAPILTAEEVTSEENPPNTDPELIKYQESFTWTFYKLATQKGHVTIRWYGSSNGYYSESVEFGRLQ